MNRQKTYDTVKAHLLKQGERSVGPGDMCMYRGPNGLKCAIGCLIPDELYDPKMEYVGSIDRVLERFFMLEGFLEVENAEDERFLTALQQAHDARPSTARRPVNFEQRLDLVAARFGLVS